MPIRSDLRKLTVAKEKIRTEEVIRYVSGFSMMRSLIQDALIEFGYRLLLQYVVVLDDFPVRHNWNQVSGVYCVVDPPVPIPNTVVKRFCGDNTGGTSLWEDSTTPD